MLALSTFARAGEPPPPALTRVFPPGVAVGSAVRVEINGRGLRGVSGLRVEGEGLTVKVVEARDDRLTADIQAATDARPGFRGVRADGPGGLSNRLVLRVDRLGQTPEREPNDAAADATPLPRGSAGAGVLDALDVDHYRVEARAGERLTVEVEARRLGVPVQPVVTVFGPGGRPVRHARAAPGVEGDCRFLFDVPETGSYVFQVRDHLYQGAPDAVYRLRVTDEPFATGLFPLAAPAGVDVRFRIGGGNLAGEPEGTFRLAGRPGVRAGLGSFRSPRGPVEAPWWPVVAEADEPAGEGVDSLRPEVVINGRLDRPGGVDRYRLPVKAGVPVRVEVAAAALGSWLDAVLTVREASGREVAANDDAPSLTAAVPGATGADSRVDLTPEADGVWTVELADRDGAGGPEYGYRLRAGPPRPDFAVRVRPPVETTGALNLRPGGETPLPFRVTFDGRPGPVVVRVEGLPPGVSAAPVTVRAGSEPASGPFRMAQGVLRLRVAPATAPVRGELAVVGRAVGGEGPVRVRQADALVILGHLTLPPPSRPVTVRLGRLPFAVVGPG